MYRNIIWLMDRTMQTWSNIDYKNGALKAQWLQSAQGNALGKGHYTKLALKGQKH